MAAVILIPFLGTILGSGMVLGLRVESPWVQWGMNGFAAGAMVAAAMNSLLVPGMAMSRWGTGLGVLLGMGLVVLAEGLGNRQSRKLHPAAVLMLAVVLHNIPEGIAVGMAGTEGTGTMLGIALQNIPDGAVVSVPLAAMGMKKGKAFTLGILSGAVEPAAGLGAAALGQTMTGSAPVMMGFAAGAMLYVIIRELIPRMGQGTWGLGWFCAGLLGILMVN